MDDVIVEQNISSKTNIIFTTQNTMERYLAYEDTDGHLNLSLHIAFMHQLEFFLYCSNRDTKFLLLKVQ